MKWEVVKKKLDNVWVGLVLGLILSVFGFFLSKWVKDPTNSYTMEGFWNLLTGKNNYNLEILTFSLLPNMLAFYFLFFQWKMDKTLKGLIFITIMFLGIIFLMH